VLAWLGEVGTPAGAVLGARAADYREQCRDDRYRPDGTDHLLLVHDVTSDCP